MLDDEVQRSIDVRHRALFRRWSVTFAFFCIPYGSVAVYYAVWGHLLGFAIWWGVMTAVLAVLAIGCFWKWRKR